MIRRIRPLSSLLARALSFDANEQKGGFAAAVSPIGLFGFSTLTFCIFVFYMQLPDTITRASFAVTGKAFWYILATRHSCVSPLSNPASHGRSHPRGVAEM